MSLTQQDVKKVAKLARLKLSEPEIEKYQNELNKILGWVDQLEEVDTSDTEPLSSVVPHSLQMRKDVATDKNLQEEVLKNAPKEKYNCFVVPKVVE